MPNCFLMNSLVDTVTIMVTPSITVESMDVCSRQMRALHKSVVELSIKPGILTCRQPTVRIVISTGSKAYMMPEKLNAQQSEPQRANQNVYTNYRPTSTPSISLHCGLQLASNQPLKHELILSMFTFVCSYTSSLSTVVDHTNSTCL